MKDELKDLLGKLRRKKEREEDQIPEGYVRCTRCGNIVKEENAVISLPESWWVCDKCYFRGAK